MQSSFELFKKQLDDAVGLIEKKKLLVPVNVDSTNSELLESINNLVDTQSLLARCESVCSKYKTEKPTIRIIHHLACSGGALISKYISAMPNVYVLSEVHPYFNASTGCSPLDTSKAVLNSHIPNANNLNQELFVNNIKKIYEHVNEQGGKLVIRDNAYFDYLSGKDQQSKTISCLLNEHFDVVSIVLYRDSIDTYASLVKAEFYKNNAISFDEYCGRATKFVSDYSHATHYQYESLHGELEKTVENICSSLQIDFNDIFNLILNDDDDLNCFDDWQASENDCYNTKLTTAPSTDEISESKFYANLQAAVKPVDKKLILISTMPRSGSTWLFNCVHKIFKEYETDIYSCWIEDYNPSHSSEIHIVKVHNCEHRLSSQADVIISTRRDVRNVCTSLIRMGWLKNEEEQIVKYVDNIVKFVHPFWHERCNLEIEYSDIIDGGESVVIDVAKLLGLNLNQKKSSEIYRALLNMKNPDKHDKETQLHPNHRAKKRTDYHDTLNKTALSLINEKYSWWFKKYGYL